MKQFLGGVGCAVSVALSAWFFVNAPMPDSTPAWLVVAGLIGIFATLFVFLWSLVVAVKA